MKHLERQCKQMLGGRLLMPVACGKCYNRSQTITTMEITNSNYVSLPELNKFCYLLETCSSGHTLTHIQNPQLAEVHKALQRVNLCKAARPDNIPVWACGGTRASEVADIFTSIFNLPLAHACLENHHRHPSSQKEPCYLPE